MMIFISAKKTIEYYIERNFTNKNVVNSLVNIFLPTFIDVRDKFKWVARSTRERNRI